MNVQHGLHHVLQGVRLDPRILADVTLFQDQRFKPVTWKPYGSDWAVSVSAAPKQREAVQHPSAPEDGNATRAVFDKLVGLKVATATVAMHLEPKWRSGFFAQLDQLLSEEDWDPKDNLPTEASFTTFLRMVVFLGHVKRPSLGVTPEGNIMAGWATGKDRLQVECKGGDRVTWVLGTWCEGVRESAAGNTAVRRLPDILQPYSPERWFAH